MSEQGPPQQTRPPRGNAYDREPPYYNPWPPPSRGPEYRLFDPANIWVPIGKIGALILCLIGAAIYARDFQRDTQLYQENMTKAQASMSSKITDLVHVMEGMTTARDLSDFCMQAQQENANWKCPSAFQWRRQGSMQPKSDKVRIQLGSR